MTRPCWLISSSPHPRRHPGVPRRAPAPRRFLPQLAGECEVTHTGRAQSTAEAGDYLLTVKPDGCLMIHRAKGVKPRNWQPATDRLSATLDDGLVVMPGERRSPPEVVTVQVVTCSAVQAFSLRFNTSFALPGSEADMQRALRRQPELIEPGLYLIAKERSTGVGSLDLFAREVHERLVVIELKRGKATHEAVHHLARHVQRVGALQPQARSCKGCWWYPPRPAQPLVLIHPESSRARCRKRWHRCEAGPFVQAAAC